MICDAASIAVMVERIGFRSARWQRMKRNTFLDTIDNRDSLERQMDIAQQPESSLSSESSSDSSQCSDGKSSLKRKRGLHNMVAPNDVVKVSSSSENIPSSSDTKANTSSSDESDKKTSKFSIPQKVDRKEKMLGRSPILSASYLSRANKERIKASYAVNQDNMIVLEDVLMCPFVFRTNNAVSCGALADCVIPGMLRASFSKNNKLLNMELVFDAMGFMQQLNCANGEHSKTQAIPNSQETAILPCRDEARVITEAHPPYSIVHVNSCWTRLTKYSQVDAEGAPLLTLLQKESVLESNQNRTVSSRSLSHCLEEVQRGRPACSTSIHYKKDGKPFVDFMTSYPLTK